MDDFTKILNDDGLLIYSKNLFLLQQGRIDQVNLKNDKLYTKPFLNNVNLDKKLNNLKVGVINENNSHCYFGSYQHGLYELYPTSFQVLKPNERSSKKFPNSNLSICYSQVELDNQSFLINNHLTLLKSGDVFINNLTEYGRALNFKDSQDNIWVSDGTDLIIKNKVTKGNMKLKCNFFRTDILGMCELDKDKYIIHSYTDAAIMEQMKLTQLFTKESFGLKDDEEINYVYHSPRYNKIYLLSNRNIYEIDFKTNSLKLLENLGKADFRIIQEIKENFLFLGTYGHGFFMFNGENWMPMPLDKHGYLKYAHAALCDTKGHLWISTNNGLFRTRLQDIEAHIQDKAKDIYYYYYDKDAGFLTNEFNGGCQSPAIKLSDGRFSFSSMNGLVQFDPLKVPAEFPNNAIQIINLWLNGIRKDTIPCNLVLDQDASNIKFEVSTSFFGHPDNLILQYKIDGMKGDWQNLNEGRYIYLQNLKYGNYSLNIRKRNYFGSDAYDIVKFQIQILPRYYETTWFYLMIFLLTILLFYGLNRWYYRFTIQKNKELDALVKLKNKDLIIVNEQLIDKIKQNDLFQSILVHDIRTPIRFISSNARLITENWNGLNENIKKNNLIQIYESTERINSFVEETLFWIHLRNGNLRIKITNFYIIDIMRENIRLFENSPKLTSGNIVINNDCQHQLQVNSDQMLVSTIIRNLLINSIKYTNNGQITLYAFIDWEGKVNFGCKDEGTGIPLDLIEIIMQDDYKGNSINSDRFKMGFVIIKELVKMLKAKLSIKTNGISGTDIRITL